MTIAHVIDAYLPELLYQEGYLAREQRRRGHRVVVVTRRLIGQPTGERVRLVSGGFPPLPFRLAGVMRDERPDVVHVHNLVSQISLAACLLKPFFRFRLVVDSHHSSINTRVATPARRLGARLFRMSAGRLIRATADAIFAIAGPERSMAAHLLGCREDEIPIVPLGVDTEAFRPDVQKRKAVRERLGIADAFVVVHAGRLVPEKGIDVLLEAAARVGATVLLVGPVDERVRPEIERFEAAGGRLLLPGIATKTELASLLRAADAGVWMGFPSLSAVEAMAVGLPLISRATPHFVELLGTDYELFAEDDEDLVELLLRLREQPEFAAKLGARNAHRADALGWDRIAERVERMYV